jgi:hypothetical protein
MKKELFCRTIGFRSEERNEDSSISVASLPGEENIIITGARKSKGVQVFMLSNTAAEYLYDLLGEWKQSNQNKQWCGSCHELLPNHIKGCIFEGGE